LSGGRTHRALASGRLRRGARNRLANRQEMKVPFSWPKISQAHRGVGGLPRQWRTATARRGTRGGRAAREGAPEDREHPRGRGRRAGPTRPVGRAGVEGARGRVMRGPAPRAHPAVPVQEARPKRRPFGQPPPGRREAERQGPERVPRAQPSLPGRGGAGVGAMATAEQRIHDAVTALSQGTKAHLHTGEGRGAQGIHGARPTNGLGTRRAGGSFTAESSPPPARRGRR